MPKQTQSAVLLAALMLAAVASALPTAYEYDDGYPAEHDFDNRIADHSSGERLNPLKRSDRRTEIQNLVQTLARIKASRDFLSQRIRMG
ncbi:hypothetical protein BOX15_Mlig011774g1 [Macrostomum lignano]|uniref:Uncharacterized protein n=1 Tax=Macrostomum lignano TaxID=282301 RepID=A0A267H7Y0_9PLAT|nr:hypothetical protein BOX15_Mlig011774g1 [Macrostomum lignano]